MKQEKKNNVFINFLFDFKKILENKPSLKKMRDEIKEMSFYIKPIEGDASVIKKVREEKIIEILWTLGKIDILIEKKFSLLTKDEQVFILKSFEKVKERLLTDLNSYFISQEEFENKDFSYLLMEVSRRRFTKKDIN